MAHTTASRYEADLNVYFQNTLLMTVFSSNFESNSQVLVPETEYYRALVNQANIIRTQDSNENLVGLQIRLRLLYRFTMNEGEYLGSAATPTKHKAATALLMDENFWKGTGGSFALTAPLDVQSIEPPELEMTRTGRVIESEITVALVTTSV